MSNPRLSSKYKHVFTRPRNCANAKPETAFQIFATATPPDLWSRWWALPHCSVRRQRKNKNKHQEHSNRIIAMIQRKKVTLKYIEATKNRQTKNKDPFRFVVSIKKDSKQTGTCIVFRKVDVLIFSFFYLFLCACTTKATLWAQWKSKFACCANTLSELGIFREEPVLSWPKPWQILQQSNTEVTRERPWEVLQMRVQKRPQQRESKAQWWVLSDGRWQPEIRNMTAPRKSAYAEWTPSLEISEDLYGRGGRDTFASQTHHRTLPSSSSSAISWHQQFESAVDISS